MCDVECTPRNVRVSAKISLKDAQRCSQTLSHVVTTPGTDTRTRTRNADTEHGHKTPTQT